MGYDRIRNHRCTECGHNRIVVAKENKCEYRLQNPFEKTVCKTRVDDCYLQQGMKCDYLLVDCDDRKAYFVELKGSDLNHAVRQLRETIRQMQPDLKGFSLFARAILTKAPTPALRNNPDILKIQKKLRGLGGNLLIHTMSFTEAI